MGAESLLGHGDMLYLPPGTSMPTRIHGAFVSDQEVHRVVEALKKAAAPNYIEEVLKGPSTPIPGISSDDDEPGMEGGGDAEQDALYDEAVKIVTAERKPSISYVQRRLKIGYNRAARMLEAMEAAGVVGPLQSNGSREVLAPPPA
jgi:S-DNA-T family DNA segregation ATPase FtsK/SpoIIIE